MSETKTNGQAEGADVRTMTLKDKQGRDLVVPVRKAQDVGSPSARYPGFKPGRTLLKAGSVRLKGYRPLPCDIILGRDGADIVEWAAAQPWCNGRIGMSSNSWLAISQ